MWKKINFLANGFLLGLILEYTVRVEVSIFPIIIGILIIGVVILELVLDKQKETKRVIPDGWEILDFGQHMNKRWYMSIVRSKDINDIRTQYTKTYVVVDRASYDEALEDVISEIK